MEKQGNETTGRSNSFPPEMNSPILELNGRRYEIDISLRELREVERPFNFIPLTDLNYREGRYAVATDDDGVLLRMCDSAPIWSTFPDLVHIAPNEVSQVYGLTIEQLPQRDSELRSPQHLIDERLSGVLPVISILGERYHIDIRQEELRSCENLDRRIPLIDNGSDAAEIDDRYVYLFDTVGRAINRAVLSLTSLPEHHVFIVIPDTITLDPIGAGQLHHNDPNAYLHRYPVQQQMQARIVPIHQTWLPELIIKNELAQEKDMQSLATLSKKRRSGRLGL